MIFDILDFLGKVLVLFGFCGAVLVKLLVVAVQDLLAVQEGGVVRSGPRGDL